MCQLLGSKLETYQIWDAVDKRWLYSNTGIRVKPKDQLYLACSEIVFDSDFTLTPVSGEKRLRSQSLDTSASGSPSKLARTTIDIDSGCVLFFLPTVVKHQSAYLTEQYVRSECDDPPPSPTPASRQISSLPSTSPALQLADKSR